MTDGAASTARDCVLSAPLTGKSAGNARAGAILRTLPFVCAIAVLWLATRRYFGVVQDARYYMVETLRGFDPARFANDLYFQFGSQGSFSLFDTLYQPFVAHFGVGAAGMGAAIAGQLLWLAGLFCLVRSLVGERYRWLAIATVIAMPNAYAPFFGYGEHFMTPRLFAEGLTMLALALLRTRPLWTFLLVGLAAVLHPLMALPGLVAAFAYFAFARPLLWLAVPMGAVFAMALGWAGIQPFADLYRTLDPDWLSIVRLRTIQCLITDWPQSAYFQLLGGLVWAGLAFLTPGAADRRFLACVLVAGIGGLVCALVGSDLAHNALITGLQPWRSIWLLLVVSRIYIPVTFAILMAKSALVADRKLDPFAVAVVLTLGLILVSDIAREVQLPNAAEFDYLSLALVVGALGLMFVRLVWADWKGAGQASLGFALLLVPLAISTWDGRTPWTKFVESPEPPPQELAMLLPQGASVYWEDGLSLLWLRLKRASYFSCDQGTGAVFHRETAMAYKHRADSFWPLRTAEFIQSSSCSVLDKTPRPARTREGLQKVCRKEPGLDYLVLMSPLEGVQPKIWKSPVQFQDIRSVAGIYSAYVTDRFYIYSCADVRRDAARTGQAVIRRG